jgi:hypothetical protein
VTVRGRTVRLSPFQCNKRTLMSDMDLTGGLRWLMVPLPILICMAIVWAKPTKASLSEPAAFPYSSHGVRESSQPVVAHPAPTPIIITFPH